MSSRPAVSVRSGLIWFGLVWFFLSGLTHVVGDVCSLHSSVSCQGRQMLEIVGSMHRSTTWFEIGQMTGVELLVDGGWRVSAGQWAQERDYLFLFCECGMDASVFFKLSTQEPVFVLFLHAKDHVRR